MRKTKTILTKGLCMLLMLVMLIPSVVYADTNSDNDDEDVISGGELASKKEEGMAWNDLWQGLRVYVVDENGSLVSGSAGKVISDSASVISLFILKKKLL